MSTNGDTPPLPFTGERMTPEGAGIDTIWEHVYRYRFAVRYARRRDVLDVACGEGYGAAALAAAGARSVVGVDIDPASCEHARGRYGRYGIDVRLGDAIDLPLADRSVDLVVTFETIEHVAAPARFLGECRRVLRPGGRLIVSTPNVEVYNPARDPARNEFHCSEMTEVEFLGMLAVDFRRVRVYTQRPVAASPRSLRSLAVAAEPLVEWQLPGYPFFRRRSRVFRPGAEGRVREDTVGAILEPDEPWLGRLANPYRVRPRDRRAAERPTYLICTATRR